jgi:hypothetical protein
MLLTKDTLKNSSPVNTVASLQASAGSSSCSDRDKLPRPAKPLGRKLLGKLGRGVGQSLASQRSDNLSLVNARRDAKRESNTATSGSGIQQRSSRSCIIGLTMRARSPFMEMSLRSSSCRAESSDRRVMFWGNDHCIVRTAMWVSCVGVTTRSTSPLEPRHRIPRDCSRVKLDSLLSRLMSNMFACRVLSVLTCSTAWPMVAKWVRSEYSFSLTSFMARQPLRAYASWSSAPGCNRTRSIEHAVSRVAEASNVASAPKL